MALISNELIICPRKAEFLIESLNIQLTIQIVLWFVIRFDH